MCAFDFELFCKLAAREYNELRRYDDYHLWSLDETLAVFFLFFETYRIREGESHPPLKCVQIADLITLLPTIYTDDDGDRAMIELFPQDYATDGYELGLIDGYFGKEYRGTNHRIFHFMTGDIRLHLLHELGLR